MKCPHCGRENETNMLFCAYCDRPLIEEEPSGSEIENAGEKQLYGKPASDVIPQSTYIPQKEIRAEELFEAEAPRIGSEKTIIPRREVRVSDMFLDDAEYDDEPSVWSKRLAQKKHSSQKSQEDSLPSGFLQRHIRGIVSLSLIAFVVVILLIWASSPGGQRTLAQLNLSRNPTSYATLAAAYGEAGSREMEGYYYSRALQFDDNNMNYAIGMANAYIASGNTVKATEALLKLIELDPGNTEAYAQLSSMYPVVSTRPDSVYKAIKQGYQITGDMRLKQ